MAESSRPTIFVPLLTYDPARKFYYGPNCLKISRTDKAILLASLTKPLAFIAPKLRRIFPITLTTDTLSLADKIITREP